jgi:UDP-N-acetylglucosamine/UDP-N-acetylgalactosamine diphosphorylase
LGQHPAGFTKEEALKAGEAALAKNKIGMILAAGGQGTRLGFDLPKGMFRIGPLSSRTLFEMQIDRLRALMRKYHASIPLYVMTSPATDAATRMFFSEFDRFGLGEDQLRIFCQGTMPAVDSTTGKVLMSSPHEIALSPNGHGGLLAALSRNGCLEDAADRNIQDFFYCQIDNPMVPVCDPLLIGYHLLSRSQITTQVVKKRFPLEKVGNVVSVDGRTRIIEYSDLPAEAAEAKNSDGSLKLWAGNIAVHIFDRRFLESMQNNVSALPFHRAFKVVPYVDERGNYHKPPQPNAFKFERFIFDLLPMAERSLVVEGDAAEVFAPVKNADGAPTDTPEATKKAISDLHKKWLSDGGAIVSDEAIVEIHPSWAVDACDAKTKAAGMKINSNTYLNT